MERVAQTLPKKMNYNITNIKKVNYFLFLSMIASLPLPRIIMQWTWIIWLISWLMEMRFLHHENLRFGKQMIPSLFLAGIVILESISMIWADGCSFRDSQLSFLILPLIILYGVNELYDWKQISKVLIISCTASVYLYIFILYWANQPDSYWLRGTTELVPFSLSLFDSHFSLIKHRMIYCSLLGIAIILLFLLRMEFIQQWGKGYGICFIVFCLSTMLIGIVATSSRANLFTLLAIGVVALILYIPKKYRIRAGIGIGMIAIACAVAIWQLHPRMKNLNIDMVVHPKDHINDVDMQPRLLIWNLALEHPKDYLSHGLGVGNSKNYLAEKYEALQLSRYLRDRFGAHCQYLTILMELGLAVLIAFIVLWYTIPLCYPKNSIGRKFIFFVTILVGLNMITDDILCGIETVIYVCMCLILAETMCANEDKQLASSAPLLHP